MSLKISFEGRLHRIQRPDDFSELRKVLSSLFGPEVESSSITYKDSAGDEILVTAQIEWDEEKRIFQDVACHRIAVSSLASSSSASSRESAPVEVASPQAVKRSATSRLSDPVMKVLSSYLSLDDLLNIPDWLKPAAVINESEPNEMNMDFNVDKLFRVVFDHGIKQLTMKNHEEGILAFENALRLVPNHYLALYNLACAQALKGDLKPALQSLCKSLEFGYSNIDHLSNDPDLVAVRQLPEFCEAFWLATKGAYELPEEISCQNADSASQPEQSEVETKVDQPAVETNEVDEVEANEAENEEPEKLYTSELESLRAMGFSFHADSVLQDALERYVGDVNAVIEWLLEIGN